jgi:MFS family permease
MSLLYRDRRFQYILAANILSSIGTGITMIAVPWLFVNQAGGKVAFGYTMLTMTVLMFVLTPFISWMIDRVSRKRMLLAGEAIGGIIVIVFVIYGFLGMTYQTVHYTILFAIGSLYYTLFYPTIFAFNQEIFDNSQYKQLNGLMEIQGQLSAVLAGGLASFMLKSVELKWILLFDAFTYAAAFILLALIPYKRTFDIQTEGSFWKKISEGYIYMKSRPVLFLFLLASFMPFIGVMVTNYLFPVYISDILHGDGSVYGLHEMVYGIGAAFAGILIPLMLQKLSTEWSIAITVLIYTIALIMYSFFPTIPLFYLLTILTAFGNAGTRVARNSFIMEMVPNEKIGRVDGLFRVVGLAFRIVLLATFTKNITDANVLVSFGMLNIILVVATIIVFLTVKRISKLSIENQPSNAM